MKAGIGSKSRWLYACVVGVLMASGEPVALSKRCGSAVDRSSVLGWLSGTPSDTALVDEPAVEPDREVRGPRRKACRRRVVDLQGVIRIMERPVNGKVPWRRYLNARVDEEKVEQAVPIRIVSAVGMRRGEMAGPGEHDGFRGYTGRNGLGLRGHRGPAA